MWFNSRRNERPHQGLTCNRTFFRKRREIRKDDCTGAAWLSSARAVRCSLKWGNERNPHPMLNYSLETVPVLQGRKEGKTSSQHGPYTLGHTHTTMAKNNEPQASDGKQISEISPQFRSESATRLREAGIGSNRRSASCGEYVLGSCTHRPSRQQSREWMKPAVRWSSPSSAMKLKS